MVYIAKHHLKVGHGMVTPGEMFEAEYTAEQEERLVRLGAIIMTGQTAQNVIHENVEPERNTPENDEVLPVNEEAVTDDTEPEPPEIDVMDGITEAPRETPKSKRRKAK